MVITVSRVTVLADDLIWSTRLVRALADAGAMPAHVRTPAALAAALDDGCRFVVVDLTARAHDGTEAVGGGGLGGREAGGGRPRAPGGVAVARACGGPPVTDVEAAGVGVGPGRPVI